MDHLSRIICRGVPLRSPDGSFIPYHFVGATLAVARWIIYPVSFVGATLAIARWIIHPVSFVGATLAVARWIIHPDFQPHFIYKTTSVAMD